MIVWMIAALWDTSQIKMDSGELRRPPVNCSETSGTSSSTWYVVSSLDSCISASQIRHEVFLIEAR